MAIGTPQWYANAVKYFYGKVVAEINEVPQRNRSHLLRTRFTRRTFLLMHLRCAAVWARRAKGAGYFYLHG